MLLTRFVRIPQRGQTYNAIARSNSLDFGFVDSNATLAQFSLLAMDMDSTPFITIGVH
jgi:hypothetical protein